MAIAFVNVGSANSDFDTVLTITIDTTSADFIACIAESAAEQTGSWTAAYHGQALTALETGNGWIRGFAGKIAAGDRGNFNLVITFGVVEKCFAACAIYSGVDQTTPYDAASVQVDATGTLTPSVAVPSEAGDTVVALDARADNPCTSEAPGTDETERFDVVAQGFGLWTGEQAGAASVTIAPTRNDGGAFWADRLIAFNVNAAAGGSVALTGTITASTTEANIIAGGKTIILTLTGDTWVTSGATFDAERQAIINGLDSAQAEAAGWDAVVKAGLAVTDVVRTSDTVVTVTLGAFASFNITAQETITATVPDSAVTGTGPYTATPTFTVDPEGTVVALMVQHNE